MTSATSETSEKATAASVREKAADACRHAAHLSHEARLLKSLATDAVEDGAHAVKRAIVSARRGVQELEDLKDEALHRVRRRPLRAMGIATGVGLVAGVIVGWLGRSSWRSSQER